MDRPGEKFESFLREFEPRRPRALPKAPDVPNTARRAVATAGLAVLCIGALWIALRELRTTRGSEPAVQSLSGQSSAQLSARELLRLAMEDPQRFDAALTAMSRNILPSFAHNDSTLRVLAKE
jgi:hypothetical protein